MEDIIEVGEYVRTKSGHISRLLKKTEDYYYFDDVVKESFGEQWTLSSVNNFYQKIEEIKKHSKQLIDLIEVGDIVKYKLKNFKHINVAIVRLVQDTRSNKEKMLIDGYNLEQIDILEILTKEQYNINCYKAGGEEYELF